MTNITETRKNIIELIENYMDNTLSEGCLIECYYSVNNGNDTCTNIIIFRDGDIFDELLIGCYDYKIIGHYDITAILKYIRNKAKIELFDDIIRVEYNGNRGKIYELKYKPLHLYTEEEDKLLLELLKELGPINNN